MIDRALIEEFHAEEIADHDKYCKLAEEIKCDYPEKSKVLQEIAHEEYTHARYFEHLLSTDF